MQSKAATVEDYLSALPEDRREALQAVREVILKHMDGELEEGMQYGMIGYYVPHRVFPDGYHCDPSQPLPYAGLASQKNHMSLYLMCNYGSETESKAFEAAWKKTGKKLDMGKSCIRFKRVEDLALDVIAEFIERATVARFIAHYVSSIRTMNKKASKSRSSAAKPKKSPKSPAKRGRAK